MTAQPDKPTVSVIIPVFNKWEMTADCLRSMRSRLASDRVEVIVVDNGSSDATPAECGPLGSSLFPGRFFYHANAGNAGFARACNQGAALAGAEILFFLNNDTLWSEDVLPALLEELDSPGVGCCGPLLLYPNDRIQHLGVGFLHSGKVVHAFRDYPRTHRVARNRLPLQAMTAAALLIRAGLLRQLGGFHEAYANGYEDLDLCHQLKSAGLRATVAQQVSLYHLEGQSAGRMDAEARNFAVYKERVGEGFATDVDVFAERNAMRLVLNEWLEPYFVADREVQEACAARVAREGQASVLDVLKEHPCWEPGYHQVIGSLRQIGIPAVALHMGRDLLRFCPSMAAVELLCVLAAEAGDQQALGQYRGMRQMLAAHASRPELPVTARRLLQFAREQGRDHLAASLKQWFITRAA